MSHHQPLVTVITVAYNSSKYIRNAIETVLTQSYKNIQYIIADDGSTDNTWQIINEYKDERMVAYKNQQNIGEYANRNKAVGLANGVFILFVDGDDLALNRGIELAVDDMMNNPNCGFGVVKKENPKFFGPLEINSKDAYNLDFFSALFLESSLSNNIYKTSILKQHLFFTKYKNADTYTRLLILKTTNVLLLPNAISIWRLTNDQVSKKIKNKQRFLERIDFIKQYIFEDENFIFFDKEKIKPHYYKLLVRIFLAECKSLNFKNILQLKQYKLNSLFSILKYVLQKHQLTYWNHYNYTNMLFNNTYIK